MAGIYAVPHDHYVPNKHLFDELEAGCASSLGEKASTSTENHRIEE